MVGIDTYTLRIESSEDEALDLTPAVVIEHFSPDGDQPFVYNYPITVIF
jgi:hypothetical protein